MSRIFYHALLLLVSLMFSFNVSAFDENRCLRALSDDWQPTTPEGRPYVTEKVSLKLGKKYYNCAEYLSKEFHGDSRVNIELVYKTAQDWLMNAAEMGNGEAQYLIGNIISRLKGMGARVESDELDWYEKAAQSGYGQIHLYDRSPARIINQHSDVSGFRNARWGMTKKEVKSTEDSAAFVSDNGDFLHYRDTIDGLKVMAVYRFSGGHLVLGKYIFLNKHVNKNKYLIDYEKLKGLLTKKYGVPTSEKDLWLNNLYRDSPSDWGMAISTGHLAKYVTWELGRTTVSMLLHGDNFKVSLGVDYMDNNFKGSLGERETLDKL